jgi:branched-chain amino acid transport system ATP-binding protein
MNARSARAEPAANAPNAAVLDARDVTVRFGGLTALDGVSLAVPPQQVTGVIGPNGAGKTTLLNVLCGFVRPDSGSISLDGRPLTRLRPHKLASLGIARTLQGVGLFGNMSVLENVMTGASVHGRSGVTSALLALPRSDKDERTLREMALQALADAGVSGVADRRPGELSYGLCKRVALARALVGRPRLLLLDEPASGLSTVELDELRELIADLAERASVVVVEHHMDLMMSVCDTLVVLDFGKVIARGTPDEVQADEAVTEAYLGVSGDDEDGGGADG